MEDCIVDRIEGTYGVCEFPDRRMVRIPLTELPDAVREGDCLRWGDGVYRIDQEKTQRRRKQAADLLRQLMNPE